MAGVVAEQAVCLPSSPEFQAGDRGTPPRSAASRDTSQLIGIEFGRSPGGTLCTRLGSEPAERIL
jgi:hypothetical protein